MILCEPSVPDDGVYVTEQLLAVALMLASWQLAKKDDGESSEALTVPDAGVEFGPDVTSLTVTIHESLVPTTTEDDAQLTKVAVD